MNDLLRQKIHEAAEEFKRAAETQRSLSGRNPAAYAAAMKQMNNLTHLEYSDSRKTACGIKIKVRGVKQVPVTTFRWSRVTCPKCREVDSK